MTPSATARPQMLVEEFEQIASAAPETVRLEFVNGKIDVKAVPDGNHGEVFMWLGITLETEKLKDFAD